MNVLRHCALEKEMGMTAVGTFIMASMIEKPSQRAVVKQHFHHSDSATVHRIVKQPLTCIHHTDTPQSTIPYCQTATLIPLQSTTPYSQTANYSTSTTLTPHSPQHPIVKQPLPYLHHTDTATVHNTPLSNSHYHISTTLILPLSTTLHRQTATTVHPPH